VTHESVVHEEIAFFMSLGAFQGQFNAFYSQLICYRWANQWM